VTTEVVLVNRRHVEVIKVWYSVFTTLMDSYDAGEYRPDQLIEKLQKMRQMLDKEVPIEEIKAS
jgi:hypothetical protein